MIDYLLSFLSRYIYAIIIITITTSTILVGIRFVNKRAYQKRSTLFLSSLVISFLLTVIVLALCFVHWTNVGYWQLYHITCEYLNLSITHTVCTAFVLLIGAAFSFAIIGGMINYYLCRSIITKLYHITSLNRQDAQRQYEILDKLSQKAEIRTPEIGLIDSGRPSIFSLGRKGKSIIAMSVGLIETLSDSEIETAFAHEISHIKNKDCLIKALASSFKFAVPFNILGFLVEPALSRDREFLADARSAMLTKKPSALISMLMKLHEATPSHSKSRFMPSILHNYLFLANKKVQLFNSHPPVPERIKRLLEIERHF